MLTTLSKAKTMMGLDSEDNSQDIELLELVAVASTMIEATCRRQFKLQTHNNKITGLPGKYIRLPNYPVHSISSISGAGASLSGVEILDFGILYRECGWPLGDRAISITYSAGYVLPSEATAQNPSTLPQTLEFACILLMKHLQREPGIQTERLGDASVTYAAGESDMPGAVKALIGPHILPDM